MNLVKVITDALKSNEFTFNLCSQIRINISSKLYKKVNILVNDIENELYQRELRDNTLIIEKLNKILELILIDSN